MKKYLRYSIYGILAVAIVIVAYNLGKMHGNGDGSNVINEFLGITDDDGQDAAIAQRVSQQMENIAYQQKAISDRQRERAEKQSELALQMRDRAEQESRIAREAEGKAVKSAHDAVKSAEMAEQSAQKAKASAQEAEKQKSIALNHQKIAEEQRDQAKRAKSISDTLTYRTLGRTLGNASQQYFNTNREISDIQAYASWYFLNKYDGNTYQSESFKALNACSKGKIDSRLQNGSSINGIALTDGGYIVATDYGEIIKINSASSINSHTLLFHDTNYDFRDVVVVKNKIYAISRHGELVCINCALPATSKQYVSIFKLKNDVYFKVMAVSDKLLLLLANKSICWYSMANGSNASQMLDRNLSSATKRGSKLIDLFFADGTHAEMDLAGKITRKTPITKHVVTAAYYDDRLGCYFLGQKDGKIDIYNKVNTYITTLVGHSAQVLSIALVGDILVSGAYDKNVLIFNLPMLQIENSQTTFMEAIKLSKIERSAPSGSLSKEWLTPVEYKSTSWPLTIKKISATNVAIGYSNGQITHLNVSVPSMANTIKNRIHRNLTPEEWNQYIGTKVSYIKFK